MSDQKIVDKKLGVFSRQVLDRQIEESKKAIEYAEQTIVRLSREVDQQRGVLKYAEHILAGFDVPSVEEKKPPLEVK